MLRPDTVTRNVVRAQRLGVRRRAVPDRARVPATLAAGGGAGALPARGGDALGGGGAPPGRAPGGPGGGAVGPARGGGRRAAAPPVPGPAAGARGRGGG